MPKHNKFRTTPEQLGDLYLNRKLSVEEIAETLKCGVKTIKLYLNKYGITKFSRGGQTVWSTITEEVLRRLYHEEKKSIPEIATALGCSETTIWKKLDRYGIRIDAIEAGARRTERNKVNFAARRSSGGYTYIKRTDHPLANINGYVSEHRVNAEAAMGRRLKAKERIHHINMQRRDNRPENLAVLPSQTIHAILHKYMERVAVYLCGLNPSRPKPVDFGTPVFWAGRWITQIDLIPAEPRLSFAEYDSMFAGACNAPAVN